jgi:hypothetical protein
VEYNRPDDKLLTAGILARITQGLIAGFEMKYDFEEYRFDSQTQTLAYNSQCWSVVAERKVERQDNDVPTRTSWSLKVKLLGMGDLARSSLGN